MSWILRLCTMNIKRRRVRTALTVLGVSIGVVSIVSMLAVGIGVKEVLLRPYETGDTVRRIEVIGPQSVTRKRKLITDKKIKDFAKLSHVENVYPVYEVFPDVKMGDYSSYCPIVGIPKEELEKMKLVENSNPTYAKNKLELILGNRVSSMMFDNAERNLYDAEKKETRQLIGKKFTVHDIITVGDDYQSFEDKWTVAGVMEGTQDEYTAESASMYCELNALRYYLKKNSVDGVIYGQPLDDEKQPIRDFVYSKAVVIVDDIDEVDAMVKRFQDMGYQTFNQKELLDEGKKTAKTLQLLLGAIGMIALVVAVIGVGNTMTTAVYDRLNEIGVLKVLGCDLDELRLMFLMESGILGAMGGVFGCGFSLCIRGLLNQIGNRVMEFEKGTQLVVMPWWLIALAIVFAAILGVLAGYFPARWASKLNPIDAVRK